MNIDADQQQIIDEFDRIGDGMAKYEYLIALGRQHPGLADEFKTDQYAVSGCQSQVWVLPRLSDGKLQFEADSDSLIIKGVLALLLRSINGRSPDAASPLPLFVVDRLGLNRHLSPSRADGILTVARHLQYLATQQREPS